MHKVEEINEKDKTEEIRRNKWADVNEWTNELVGMKFEWNKRMFGAGEWNKHNNALLAADCERTAFCSVRHERTEQFTQGRTGHHKNSKLNTRHTMNIFSGLFMKMKWRKVIISRNLLHERNQSVETPKESRDECRSEWVYVTRSVSLKISLRIRSSSNGENNSVKCVSAIEQVNSSLAGRSGLSPTRPPATAPHTPSATNNRYKLLYLGLLMKILQRSRKPNAYYWPTECN